MAITSLKDHICYEIATRYSTFDRPKNGSANVVIDSFAPRAIIEKLKYGKVYDFPSTSYTMSAYLSELFQVKEMPIEMAADVLGFDKKQIHTLLLKVKRKKLNMVFAGFGGTGTNTAHWLSKMLVWTGQVNLFQNVSVYDDDDLDVSNLLRIPFSVSAIPAYSAKKVKMFSNYGRLSASRPEIFATRLNVEYVQYFRNRARWQENEPDVKQVENPNYSASAPQYHSRAQKTNPTYAPVPKENTFFYGAPDLASREQFKDLKFISATHGDNECSLIIKPLIDTSLQVESYGLISLSAFFMNQLRMSIALLEFLAADDETKWDTPAEEVFTFNFKDYVEAGDAELKYKKLSWQLDHDGQVILPEDI